jgi:nucleotide-binding universal stress UspA family protein
VKRFKNILVVAGDDPHFPVLLDRAVDLAQRNDGRVTLFGVVDSERAQRRATTGGGATFDVASFLVDARTEELEEAASRVAAADMSVPMEVVVATGRDFVEVIRRVLHAGHDLVMVGSSPESRFPALAGSSLAMHLLRKCPVPVWVDAANAPANPDVAVAVGPFDEGIGEDALDVALLEIGTSLAARRGGTLHVIHAWKLDGESLLRRGRVGPPPEKVDAMVAEELQIATMGLKRLLEFKPDFDVPVELHMQKGEASDVIERVLETHEPGVVVMGTLARAGLKGVFMGNTAERVLGTVGGSVLAVKPGGFETPVVI